MKKRLYQKQSKKFDLFMSLYVDETVRDRIFNDKSMHKFVFKYHDHKHMFIRNYSDFALCA